MPETDFPAVITGRLFQTAPWLLNMNKLPQKNADLKGLSEKLLPNNLNRFVVTELHTMQKTC